MTTFNLKDINKKLSDIKGAEGNIAEEKALGERLSELQGSRNHLSEVQEKINTLKQAASEGEDEISIAINLDVNQFQSIQNQLQDRLDKFDQDPTNENFMGGNKWNRLVSLIRDSCNTAISAFEKNWETIVREKLGSSPEELERVMGKEGPNVGTMAKYKQTYYEGFAAVEKFTEENQINIKLLLQIAEKLIQIRKIFVNIPDDLKEFFEDAARSGFPLEKYTAEIEEWLKENKVIDRYVIGSRRDH
ncbi:hypothetical protein OAJ77_00825 [Rhodospirillales bacterium]|nr:hypothetical protein [Rhodospirillales bacterium]